MAVVLGIDAAWSARNPSAVAVAAKAQRGWRLIAAEASCGAFLGEAAARPRGGPIPVAPLVARAAVLAGALPEVVAVDMPLSLAPIVGRRTCDNAVASAFWREGCATHSPGAERPGPLGEALRDDFAAAGFPLRLAAPLAAPALIEAYPHPALVRLTGARRRLPYKASRLRRYWPDMFQPARLDALFEVWSGIVEALDAVFADAARLLLPPETSAPAWALKAYEDRLDAAVCALVAAAALEGRGETFGDAQAAIWVPTTG